MTGRKFKFREVTWPKLCTSLVTVLHLFWVLCSWHFIVAGSLLLISSCVLLLFVCLTISDTDNQILHIWWSFLPCLQKNPKNYQSLGSDIDKPWCLQFVAWKQYTFTRSPQVQISWDTWPKFFPKFIKVSVILKKCVNHFERFFIAWLGTFVSNSLLATFSRGWPHLTTNKSLTIALLNL